MTFKKTIEYYANRKFTSYPALLRFTIKEWDRILEWLRLPEDKLPVYPNIEEAGESVLREERETTIERLQTNEINHENL